MLLNKDDWILDKEIFQSVGKDILQRWKQGKGSWLDLVNKKGNEYYLDFQDIYQGECVLKQAFEKTESKEEDIITAVILLDEIYHTCLPNPIRYARNLYRSRNFRNVIYTIRETKTVKGNQNAIDCVRMLAELDKNEPGGSYTYSFATKFSNWINNRFPIFDRYVAGIIYRRENPNNFIQSDLGDYAFFVDQYDRIIKKYKLENSSYKDIDICMWTYAKIHKLAWNEDFGIDVVYKS